MAVTIDGTTGITTPSVESTGASTFTGALALPAGGLNVGSGQLAVDASGRVTMAAQPAFFAIPPTSFAAPSDTIIAGTWSATRNQGSHFNVSGGIFTAAVAGTYLIIWNVFLTGTSGRRDAYLTVNGSIVARNEISGYSTANINISASVSACLYLQANDVVRFGAYGGTTYSSSSPWSNASGFLIG